MNAKRHGLRQCDDPRPHAPHRFDRSFYVWGCLGVSDTHAAHGQPCIESESMLPPGPGVCADCGHRIVDVTSVTGS